MNVMHDRPESPPSLTSSTPGCTGWKASSPYEVEKPRLNAHESIARLVDFLADGRKPGWLRFGADLLSLSGAAQRGLAGEVRRLVMRTRGDGRPHSLMQSYAGPHGHPAIFVESTPSSEYPSTALDRLRTYMTVKKHQLRSDRSLGIVLNERQELEGVLYLNDLPRRAPSSTGLRTCTSSLLG